MDLIYDLCDYIYVLNKGKITIEGNSNEVFKDDLKIKEAGLNSPWLVKIHKNMNLPLFKKEEDLYNYFNKRCVNPINN